MKFFIECPFCGQRMHLMIASGPVEYKEVTYTVAKHYYECVYCKETYTTTETDEATLSQIPNSIWSKNHD